MACWVENSGEKKLKLIDSLRFFFLGAIVNWTLMKSLKKFLCNLNSKFVI